LKGKVSILEKSMEIIKGRQDRGPVTERANRRIANSTIDIM
jgi:hypothetical protein